jgi:mannose-6-phosphate isomerase-like protein (cupin superfamily)
LPFYRSFNIKLPLKNTIRPFDLKALSFQKVGAEEVIYNGRNHGVGEEGSIPIQGGIMPEKVKILTQYEGCIAYDCCGAYYIRLDKGTTASDHTHDDQEIIYLMEGEAEMILGDKKQTIKAPVKITVPPKVYCAN